MWSIDRNPAGNYKKHGKEGNQMVQIMNLLDGLMLVISDQIYSLTSALLGGDITPPECMKKE